MFKTRSPRGARGRSIFLALALLPFAATVGLWARSYRAFDGYGFSQSFGVSAERGELLIVFVKPNGNFRVEPPHHVRTEGIVWRC